MFLLILQMINKLGKKYHKTCYKTFCRNSPLEVGTQIMSPLKENW